jgi:hypothetical protein
MIMKYKTRQSQQLIIIYHRRCSRRRLRRHQHRWT